MRKFLWDIFKSWHLWITLQKKLVKWSQGKEACNCLGWWSGSVLWDVLALEEEGHTWSEGALVSLLQGLLIVMFINSYPCYVPTGDTRWPNLWDSLNVTPENAAAAVKKKNLWKHFQFSIFPFRIQQKQFFVLPIANPGGSGTITKPFAAQPCILQKPASLS